MKTVLYGRYSKGSEKTVTTTPPALAVNTYPANAKSFELQGKSLALNQQIYQMYNTIDPSLTGLTVTFVNGVLSVSGTADVTLNIKFLDNGDLVANHKYYFNAPTGSSTSGYRPYFATSVDSYTTDSIITWTSGKGSFNIRVNGGTSTGFSYYPQFIDLTQMFGPGFEPTTVDQLKAIIDLDKYIPHNPGTFIHNNATYEVNKWNQLVNLTNASGTIGGVAYTINNGRVTFNGTCSASNNLVLQNISILSNHKYLLTNYPQQMPISAIPRNTLQVYEQNIINVYLTENDTVNGRIETASGSGTAVLRARIDNGQTYSMSFFPQFIDLTDIFGAGKEPSTVDECKLRFLSMGIDVTKYQPYSPLGGQCCGYRNIWDEAWELGSIDSSGNLVNSDSQIRSKNFCRCLDNTSYYSKGATLVYWYDSNEIFISRVEPSGGAATVTSPTGAYYFKIRKDNAITYNKNDISIYQVSNKVDLGFNIWDEEWELGTLNSTTGEPEGSSNTFRTRNFISILPNTNYCFTHPKGIAQRAVYYDINKNFVSYADQVATNQSYTVIHTPANAYFYKFIMYETTYNHDICINLSQTDTTKSPHNGDYRPYLMLRGIGSDFNVWDEQWELGTINATTGELTDSTTMIRSKNKLPVLPSTTYYFQIPSASSTVVAIHAYNANGTWLGMYQPGGGWITSGGAYNLTTQTFTTPSSAAFLRFRLGTSYGTTYKNNICINLSQPQTTINPHNGQYVPHLFDTYDSMSGILTRRIGVVDLGTLDWDLNQAHGFTAIISNTIENCKNAVSDRYIGKFSANNYTGADMYAALNDKEFCFYINAKRIFIKDTSYSNAATFKAAMKGVMLLYELSDSISQTTITQPISFVAGKLNKQYGVVDLGSLAYAYQSTYHYFYTNITTGIILNAQYNVHPLLYSSRYLSVETEYTGSSNIPDKSITFLRDGNPQEGSIAQYLRINDFAFTDATAFKNSLQGQYLIYKLADSATNPTYATAGNLIQKTKGDVGDVDFNLTYNTLLNENKFLISYNMGTSQSPDKRLINVGGILNA